MFPPRPPLCQRLCSSHRLSLIILGFNIVLLVAICMVAARRTQLQMELWNLKEKFDNFSSSTRMEMESLSFYRGSTGNKVMSLEANVEKQLKELKAGTECCPVNWIEFKGSCYWFSQTGSTWSDAESYCQLEKAHLVVINSREEQKFVTQHTNSFRNWIGLTDSDGTWKWVDGTEYRSSYRNWAPLQPDGWAGHEVGLQEDCAEIQRNGLWNDDSCLNFHRWVCEMKSNFTS